jgi:hypothetical protein
MIYRDDINRREYQYRLVLPTSQPED